MRADPGVPSHIGKLMPGTFTTITLGLHVPLTVKKLELTESGTVENGRIVPYPFSLSHVVVPSSAAKVNLHVKCK